MLKPFQKTLFLTFISFASYSQTLEPTATMALLKGIVTNFKGKALSKELISFENSKTKAVFQATTDAKGMFQALIPVDATYNLKYKNFTTDMNYTQMQVPADPNAVYEVTVRIDPPKEFVLDNVYFDTGKSSLKPSSSKALNDLVSVLKLKNTMVIEIQGHTDNVGKEEDNLKLSQLRAEEVKKYLVAKGIPAARITAKGYGPTMPVADNADETGRAKNRRTSLKVIKE
jgi:outer membrane protein OmpA-like peptidoglycan-associated protein